MGLRQTEYSTRRKRVPSRGTRDQQLGACVGLINPEGYRTLIALRQSRVVREPRPTRFGLTKRSVALVRKCSDDR
jgi:hypothetical protein